MKIKSTVLQTALVFVLCCAVLFTYSVPVFAGGVEVDNTIEMYDDPELKAEWKTTQDYTLADPAPWNLSELKQVVDLQDPRSVCAYFVWAVCRMVDNKSDGMEMMKYLYADLEPYDSGFTEGGKSGNAGWDSYFNERLSSDDYKWLPRTYFNGATNENGFTPTRPLSINLIYNDTNTKTLNAQSVESLGRHNIEYGVKSNAKGNQFNIMMCKFEGSDRWYVSSGNASGSLFYQQLGVNKTKAASTPNDTSTEAEHAAKYGSSSGSSSSTSNTADTAKTTDTNKASEQTTTAAAADAAENAEKTTKPAQTTPKYDPSTLPFTDVPEDAYYAEHVAWAYDNNVTTGTTETTFGPKANCTRGQVVTFLWRAAGCPEPENANNPFTDVKSSDYYYKPILWAVEKGITTGTSATKFSPNQTCSSAHIITFLYRAANEGMDGWYEEAKTWAEDNNLLSDTGLNVTPDEKCPRGAVVTFLSRQYNQTV